MHPYEPPLNHIYMLSIGAAANTLGVSPATLRRWERKGIISPQRTPGNHRRYAMPDLDKIYAKSRQHESESLPDHGSAKAAIYARVSQHDQKVHGDLERQISLLKYTAERQNLTIAEIYSDLGLGLNDKRRGLLKMIHDAAKGKFSKILVTYPDRLSRFCVSYLENHLRTLGVSVEYAQIPEERTPEDELVADMTAIVTCFSAKLHGLRAAKNRELQKERIKQIIPRLLNWLSEKQLNHIDCGILKEYLAEHEIKPLFL